MSRKFNCLLIFAITLAFYGILWIGLDFNYLNSFFNAAEAESGEGYKLFTNTGQFIETRIKNVMDILVFFGPVLIVLFYQGFLHLKDKQHKDKSKRDVYNIVRSALIALLIIFLTGAYDHGETARAAMYIYIFLLIPVAIQIKEEKYCRKDKIILLGLVFAQALIMQLFGNYIW